ncbi:MAG: tRNA 2-thiouridine(34) synthase MnmA, partial [Alphaproteobacteria bacterium]|nr:tRNA 2-thiouridine(34) synthase MnmA [Alphaproteobacteria bacterium]
MKVLVGLSGGVDSAVTACLLKQAGHEVIGATMTIWDEETMRHVPKENAGCFSPHAAEDIELAKHLCEQLDIPYHVLDCAGMYKQKVLDCFKSEYLSGRTPNPCVLCNEFIKFDALPSAAKQSGISFDKFATGHYAQISYDEKINRWQLKQGVDTKKDQTYFIYRLKQEQLSRILMPLGGMTKEQVRALAEKYNLPVKNKADSQDFYTGDLNDIIQATPKQGNFVDKTGRILGTHQGIWRYTVGQRKGLGISADKPLYVLELNADKNEVVLGYAEECYHDTVSVGNLVWVSVFEPSKPIKCFVKMRSTQIPTEAVVSVKNNIATLSFEMTQKGIAKGQSAVFYDADGFVLGGGIIEGR